jgi:hypothetical protein
MRVSCCSIASAVGGRRLRHPGPSIVISCSSDTSPAVAAYQVALTTVRCTLAQRSGLPGTLCSKTRLLESHLVTQAEMGVTPSSAASASMYICSTWARVPGDSTSSSSDDTLDEALPLSSSSVSAGPPLVIGGTAVAPPR